MRNIKFFILVLLFALCLGFTSCKKDKDNNEGNEQTEHTHNYVDGVCSCGDVKVEKFTVTFIDHDGTILKSMEVEKGSSAIAPSSPSREGFVFKEWDKSFDNVTSNLEVKALYEVVVATKYSVTFNADNGSANQVIDVEEGKMVSKPTDPVKEYYTFMGWYNGETLYDFNSSVNSDITLTAKWVANVTVYNIIIDQMLDEPSTYVVEVPEGDTLKEPATPVKAGYVFKGWFVDGEAYDFSLPVTGEFTLTASWEEEVIEYTVTLKPNGGKIEGNVKKIVFTNYEDVVLPTITRANFVFVGWYENSEKVEGITENRDYTLTAKWVGATFNITYELNGGNFEGEYETTYQYGTSFVIPVPVRENYTFAGWYKASDFSGSEVTRFTTSQKGDVTLYAKWERYVVYELNGGNWSYKKREEMVDDFLTDALAWAGKSSRPNGMVQGAGNTSIGFANVFTGANIQNIFDDATYGPKWSWMKEYIIEATDLAASKSSLKSNSEPFWRYSIGAFLFEEFRSGYPITEDFTIDTKANGFWDTLSKGCENTFVIPEDGKYKEPVRIYYVFDGWYLSPDFSGEKVETLVKDCTVYAKWIEEVPVESITITNKVSALNRYDVYQLTWDINPSDAAIKSVLFTSSNNDVLAVSDKGIVSAISDGTATITIKSLSPSGVTDSVTITVTSPAHFNISYNSLSYVKVGEDIQLTAEYIKVDKSVHGVSWSSLNSDIATVSETGVVVGVKSGVATIRATEAGGEYVDFVVTVLTLQELEEFKFVLENHNSNVFTRYNLGIGAGVPVYYDDIIGGVSKYLFEEYVVHKDHYLEDPYCTTNLNPGIEFITVHYAADMTGSAVHGGENLATFNVSKNNGARDASWHFGVGNDGVWACQNEKWGAWHAGSSKTMTWTDSGVTTDQVGTDIFTPHVTMGSDGYFYIKGVKTVLKNTSDGTKLNKMGLAVKIVGNKIYLGGHYHNSTYNFISSTGGNNNSIGIETSCAEGSDQWLTWQYTAQLVANLLVKYNLELQRVVGHHFFSGKDCPQQLLENDLEIWWEFIDMVEAEYKALTTYKDLKMTMSVVSGNDILASNGRITSQPTFSEVVTYQVTLGNGASITLATQVPGVYNK